eukprot:7641282-Prorocentrum_lima.AAC.1
MARPEDMVEQLVLAGCGCMEGLSNDGSDYAGSAVEDLVGDPVDPRCAAMLHEDGPLDVATSGQL